MRAYVGVRAGRLAALWGADSRWHALALRRGRHRGAYISRAKRRSCRACCVHGLTGPCGVAWHRQAYFSALPGLAALSAALCGHHAVIHQTCNSRDMYLVNACGARALRGRMPGRGRRRRICQSANRCAKARLRTNRRFGGIRLRLCSSVNARAAKTTA